MPTEKPRFTLIMDEKLLELIDDFRDTLPLFVRDRIS